MQSVFAGRVGELVNGLTARVWDFTDPAGASIWRQRSFALFAGDTFAALPRVTINGGLRFENIGGSADAHDATIGWSSLLPRAGIHWMMLNFWQLSAFGQYGRYAHRLPLGDLAYGDPTAPTATVARWTGPADPAEPLARRSPRGADGAAPRARLGRRRRLLDHRRRSSARRWMKWCWGSRRGRGRTRSCASPRSGGSITTSSASSNVGVPLSTYSHVTVPDMGIDIVGSGDDQNLLFYNRAPSTFGADRYL